MEIIELAGDAFELLGAGLIVVGVLVATTLLVPALLGRPDRARALHQYKMRIARALLLGLEVLVAGGGEEGGRDRREVGLPQDRLVMPTNHPRHGPPRPTRTARAHAGSSAGRTPWSVSGDTPLFVTPSGLQRLRR